MAEGVAEALAGMAEAVAGMAEAVARAGARPIGPTGRSSGQIVSASLHSNPPDTPSGRPGERLRKAAGECQARLT